MKLLFVKFTTALSLGVPNLVRVLFYRLGLKLKLNPIFKLKGEAPHGAFFFPSAHPSKKLVSPGHWHGNGLLFGYIPYPVDALPPDWHKNPINGEVMEYQDRPWWEIPDFDPKVGDIKLIWEASRFDWVLSFAQRVKEGDHVALETLNSWLNDWCEHNPPYFGANWKCGQEASIRVMHLAMASLIIGSSHDVSAPLLELIRLHLCRIAPTLQYAIAQDNNHGTSEAAALYIGGSLLASYHIEGGAGWRRMGVYWLENRSKRLIGKDGSFSQYSVTYHRVLLDTLCMVELWRLSRGDQQFSTLWNSRAGAATHWLYTMVRGANGDAPNLGANDGARLLPLLDDDYRDFRPTVQMSSRLFLNANAYPSGPWDDRLEWFGLSRAASDLELPASRLSDSGGLAVLHANDAMVVMRYPRFRFRPSQADAMHVDLWRGNTNLLRDAGSYSYNTEPVWQNYFPGTQSHNTVQFDGRDQMPRLSRFLFGRWLKTRERSHIYAKQTAVSFSASYIDSERCSHKRSILLDKGGLKVSDEINGFKEKAVLRWRLSPGGWVRESDYSFTNGRDRISIEPTMSVRRCEVIDGWESRYYLQKHLVPVLELEVTQPGSLITEYRWDL